MAKQALFASLFLFLSYFTGSQAQGLATDECSDSGLDWYIGAVGETPCRTYERLRQICNSDFRVGTLGLRPSTPRVPDICDDTRAECCCNNIAFSLSMLCLTCQRGLGPQGFGADAAIGTYQGYLSGDNDAFCQPQVNKTLPDSVQSSVCQNNIKIYDDLYQIMWSDGAWFYAWTRNEVTKNHAQRGNAKTFSKCPENLSSSSSVSTSTGSTTSSTSEPSIETAIAASSQSSSSGIGSGAIAGIVIGVLGAIGIGVFLGILFYRKRMTQNSTVHSGSQAVKESSWPPVEPYAYTNHSSSSPWSESGGSTSPSPSQAALSRGRKVAEPRFVVNDTSSSYDSRPTSSSNFTDRHTDGGPAPGATLNRHESGRLPPAYGDLRQ